MTGFQRELINRAVPIEGYVNPVAYDSKHESSIGYWVCKRCESSFFGGGDAIHNVTCPIKRNVKGIFSYKHPDMIYVLGSQETGYFSPYGKNGIEKIKELAELKFRDPVAFDRLYPVSTAFRLPVLAIAIISTMIFLPLLLWCRA